MLSYVGPDPQEPSELQRPPLQLLLSSAVGMALARRLHYRVLVEALIAGGAFSRDELDAKLAAVWCRDVADVVAELWRLVPSAIDLVSEEELCTRCGAACCKSAAIMLTPPEADTLRRRARAMGVVDLEIFSTESGDLGDGDSYRVPRWTMPAFPCVFLVANRCRVYADRPRHCANHPTYWREECAVSWRRYHRGTARQRRSAVEPPADFVARLLRDGPRW